jgi:hypothetical protein
MELIRLMLGLRIAGAKRDRDYFAAGCDGHVRSSASPDPSRQLLASSVPKAVNEVVTLLGAPTLGVRPDLGAAMDGHPQYGCV